MSTIATLRTFTSTEKQHSALFFVFSFRMSFFCNLKLSDDALPFTMLYTNITDYSLIRPRWLQTRTDSRSAKQTSASAPLIAARRTTLT